SQHLLLIELDSYVLDAERPVLVYKRSQKRMIDVAARVFLEIDAITFSDVSDLSRRTGKKRPTGRVRLVGFGVALEDLRRVALGVHGNRDEVDLWAEVRAETILNPRHLCREKWTGIRAACKDEGDRQRFAAQVLQSDALAVLLRERKLRRGFDLRQIFSVG